MIVERYRHLMTEKSDYFWQKRNEQMVQAMYDSINRKLGSDFYNNENVKAAISETEKKVLAGKISAYQGAAELLDIFKG